MPGETALGLSSVVPETAYETRSRETVCLKLDSFWNRNVFRNENQTFNE